MSHGKNFRGVCGLGSGGEAAANIGTGVAFAGAISRGRRGQWKCSTSVVDGTHVGVVVCGTAICT